MNLDELIIELEQAKINNRDCNATAKSILDMLIWCHESPETLAALKRVQEVNLVISKSSLSVTIVPTDEYHHLINRDNLLVALEANGVDNWEGFESAQEQATLTGVK